MSSDETQAALSRAHELVESGQLDEARAIVEPILAADQNNADAWWIYAHAVTDSDQGRNALENVLRIDPNFVPAMNDAAHALAASPNASDRNGPEAVKFAERAVELSGARNPVYLDTLAAAYAEVGKYPDAVAAERRALDLAAEQHHGQLEDGLKARIKLYESHQPYRDSMENSP